MKINLVTSTASVLGAKIKGERLDKLVGISCAYNLVRAMEPHRAHCQHDLGGAEEIVFS